MTDTVNTIRNTIIEHSVHTEAAVVDTIYETSEVLLMNIESLRKEVRQTNASVERLETTINNLFNNFIFDEARENAAMIRDLEIKSGLKQKPGPVEERVYGWMVAGQDGNVTTYELTRNTDQHGNVPTYELKKKTETIDDVARRILPRTMGY